MSRNGNLFVPLGGFGRNINHDPRSWAYRAARKAVAPGAAGVVPKDVGYEIHIAPLNQGNLGRCVPTAGTAMLATDPFWDTLSKELRAMLTVPALAEEFAVQAYRDVTRLDPFSGAWEPDDTGSDGLSLWKLFQARGYVNGSEHVMGIEDAHAALQGTAEQPGRPFPIGIPWLSEMFQPGADGVVKVNGTMQGGHEVLVYRYELARDLWWIRNSWGRSWGHNGDFAIDTPGYLKLMSMQADGTPMVPLTAPPPEPTPQPSLRLDRLDIWAERVDRFPKGKPIYEKLAAADWKAGREALR